MTFVLISLIVAGLLVFLSQTSYARIAGSMYGYRDQMTLPRLRPLQKKADLLHCMHHSAHALCGLLMMVAAITLLIPSLNVSVVAVSACAWAILAADAIVFIANRYKHSLVERREEITRKWKGEKVFGPEHDNEVSLFRTLSELTAKNLIRDIIHALVFAVLTLISV
jgi:hypothetical protein